MPISLSHAEGNVAIVLLAAGASTRMGRPKQLLQFRNSSLVRYLSEIALGSRAMSTCVVLGADSARIERELADLPVTILHNPRWPEGMSTSMKVGLASLPDTVSGAIIMLCDQPFVTVELLNSMMESYRSSGKPITACQYAGTLGVPVLFDRSLFPELFTITGDRGAKEIVTLHAEDVHRISFPDGTVDLDTPSDIPPPVP